MPDPQGLALLEALAMVRHLIHSPFFTERHSLASLAGGAATSAQLRAPLGVAPDGLGGLFIADCEL